MRLPRALRAALLAAACTLAFTTSVWAQQPVPLSKAEAQEAARVLKAAGEIRRFCAECGDTAARQEKIDRIEIRPAGAYWVMLVNGRPDQPQNLYFREGKSWVNLAIRQGLLQAGVPENLDARVEGANCGALGKAAQKSERRMAEPTAYRVIGSGRLPFHSAPDPACRDPKVFVIPGDKLTGYAEYPGWVGVMYTNPASNASYTGWVESRRLQTYGTLTPAQNR